MTDHEYISMMQRDPLYRDLPGRDGDRFAVKIAVAALAGLLLAAVGGLTDASRDHADVPSIEQPWTAGPSAYAPERREAGFLAAR